MARVKKMSKAALLMLAVNLLADKTVLNVVKDQIVGRFYDQMEEAGDYVESAFLDTYGDFEHMVAVRRHADMMNGGRDSRVPYARASPIYHAPDSMRLEMNLDASDAKITTMKGQVKSVSNANDYKFTDESFDLQA